MPDYILKNSLDYNTELCFTLTPKISRRYSGYILIHITDTDNADYIAVTPNILKDAKTLLHQIENIADDIDSI